MGELDQQLEIVRRGYDPHQVQRLVGSLAGELKALAVENAALREQLAAAEARPAEPPSHSLTAGDDATAARSRETADVLDAARLNVARVMERATKEAAELLAAAEHEAQEKAAQQSTAALAAAEAHAKEMLDGAEAELAQVTALLEPGGDLCELAELTALRETLRTQFSDTRAQLAAIEATMDSAAAAELQDAHG